MKNNRKNYIILALMVVFVSGAMRAPMGSVGPLIGIISADLSLSSSAAGFLTTIPLLLFALSALFAGKITSKINTQAVLYGSISVIAIGLVLRSYCGVLGLFGGTVLLGLGIGVLNVLMPALIRNQFAKIGLILGIHTAAMNGASAIAAGSAQSLSEILGGWSGGMAAIIVLPIAALAFCFAARSTLASDFPAQEAGGERYKIWTLKNIAIALFLGLQSILFFALITWLPTMAQAAMPVNSNTGMLVLGLQAISIVPALIVPSIIGKLRSHGLFIFLTSLLFIAGFLCMILWDTSLAAIIAATALFGLGAGASISIAMTLIAMQGSTAAETARASALIQGISAVIGAIGPTGAGWLFDSTGSWKAILWSLLALSFVMAAIGGYAGRRKR